MKNKPIYVNGIKNSDKSLSSNIEDVFLKSTNNMEWLSPGDIVLLKPALNSPDSYPSTTHPLAIHVISRILTENGAKVVVGDQSGIQHVLHGPGGVIHGNSKDNYIKSGMAAGSDEYFISFEDEGWGDGFYHHISSKTPSWPDGFFVTRWMQKADHVINLPRVSAHSQAGATLGFKNMVGCLREDSRLEFHANGPFNFAIKNNARGSSLKSVDDHSNTFFEKIVEISDAINDKLRLTLFVAEKAQTTFGPDSQAVKLGKLKIARAHVTTLKPGLIFASSDQVAAESFALSLLKIIRKKTPFLPRLSERMILFTNGNQNKLDKLPVKKHPYIQHSVDIGLGKMSMNIQYDNVPHNLRVNLEEILTLTN